MNNQEQLDGKTVSANKHLVDRMIEKWDVHEKEKKADVKKAHSETLDDLVSVNSLFTVAVFVGLSAATRGKDSLENRDECNAGAQVRKMLIVYEVLAFAFFILSSIVAKLIKLHLRLHGSPHLKLFGEPYRFFREKIDLKDIMLIVAAFASAAGIVLLTLSVVNIVQIRIGLFSCGSSETRAVVVALCLIVGSALVIYVVSMPIAIYASMQSDAADRQTEKYKKNNNLHQLFKEVEKIDTISTKARMKVYQQLCEDPSSARAFLSCPEDSRALYVLVKFDTIFLNV